MQCIQPGSWFHYFCPVNTFMWVLLFMVKDRHTLLKALHKYIDKWREYIGRMGCRRIKDCSKRFLKPMNDTKYPSLSPSLSLSVCRLLSFFIMYVFNTTLYKSILHFAAVLVLSNPMLHIGEKETGIVMMALLHFATISKCCYSM